MTDSKDSAASQGETRRWSERLELNSEVLMLQGEMAWKVVLEDISSGGCRIRCNPACRLRLNDFVLIYPSPVEDSPVLPLTGRVARVDEHHYGIAFQTEADSNRF